MRIDYCTPYKSPACAEQLASPVVDEHCRVAVERMFLLRTRKAKEVTPPANSFAVNNKDLKVAIFLAQWACLEVSPSAVMILHQGQ